LLRFIARKQIGVAIKWSRLRFYASHKSIVTFNAL